MFEIVTERLRLKPLDLEALYLLKQDRLLMEQHLQLVPSHQLLEPDVQKEIDEALDFWIAQVQTNRTQYRWFTNWEIIRKDTNSSIGGIGFVGMPDATGTVTIGYGLDQRHRNQGYATESVRALVQWAFESPRTNYIVAKTRKDNLASMQVLRKNGFMQAQEREECLVWLLGREMFRRVLNA